MPRTAIAVCAASLLIATPCLAQAGQTVDPYNPLGHIIYPAGGQDAQTQSSDTQECYGWASETTGLDPFRAYQQALAAQQNAASANERQGEVVGGAARGAIGGLIIGAIAGDAGTGAAIGAASGGLIGAMRRNERRRGQQEQANSQTANAEAQLERWDQAYTACLEGRNYTVK